VDLAVAMPESSQLGHGTSQRIGIAADVDVPIVRVDRPKVTVVERGAQR
jgi:hypothetical protein